MRCSSKKNESMASQKNKKLIRPLRARDTLAAQKPPVKVSPVKLYL